MKRILVAFFVFLFGGIPAWADGFSLRLEAELDFTNALPAYQAFLTANGLRLQERLTVDFDVRSSDGDVRQTATFEQAIYTAERASFQLGVRNGRPTECFISMARDIASTILPRDTLYYSCNLFPSPPASAGSILEFNGTIAYPSKSLPGIKDLADRSIFARQELYEDQASGGLVTSIQVGFAGAMGGAATTNVSNLTVTYLPN